MQRSLCNRGAWPHNSRAKKEPKGPKLCDGEERTSKQRDSAATPQEGENDWSVFSVYDGEGQRHDLTNLEHSRLGMWPQQDRPGGPDSLQPATGHGQTCVCVLDVTCGPFAMSRPWEASPWQTEPGEGRMEGSTCQSFQCVHRRLPGSAEIATLTAAPRCGKCTRFKLAPSMSCMPWACAIPLFP